MQFFDFCTEAFDLTLQFLHPLIGSGLLLPRYQLFTGCAGLLFQLPGPVERLLCQIGKLRLPQVFSRHAGQLHPPHQARQILQFLLTLHGCSSASGDTFPQVSEHCHDLLFKRSKLLAGASRQMKFPALQYQLIVTFLELTNFQCFRREIAGETLTRGLMLQTLGLFPVRVMLHPEVSVSITVNVARSLEEAERQARGENVLSRAGEQETETDVAEFFEEGAAPVAEEDKTAE